ncbi:putative acetate transporter [Heterobasidion irregulare TC 32-1]|uniref:Putative acetate transporter n=1 Tax=Heterobasidion irregulare (strain TC 32-1) TaxID=747525 RepID=W4JZD3_HETIT|nr:putative acetate transporter [Heterobasidion irregulare TC 32-1]ETW78445.1 putative acetate transporter [Heterobasidion irregulare TC 32-1]
MSDIEKAEISANSLPPHARSSPQPRRRIANPGPLGLFSFASTTLILSLYNAQARHITVGNAVVGMALFCGGLAQLLAGMWEFATGNTFGATAFTSYGAFWLSYATLLIPGSGISDAYDGSGQEDNALGIYLITWMIVTFFFLLASLRRSAGFISLFVMLTLTFMLLAISKFLDKPLVGKAGGGTGVVTAFIAYYCGMCELLTAEDFFTLPIGRIPPRRLD